MKSYRTNPIHVLGSTSVVCWHMKCELWSVICNKLTENFFLQKLISDFQLQWNLSIHNFSWIKEDKEFIFTKSAGLMDDNVTDDVVYGS